MAKTGSNTNLTPVQWDTKFLREFLNDNYFRPVMGTGKSAIIYLKEDLIAKKGKRIWMGLINALGGDGVTGNQRLKGNERRLIRRSHPIDVNVERQGVVVDEWEEQMSPIDLRNAGKVELKEWIVQKFITGILNAFGSIDGVNYADATETNKDTWLTNNADRVLFGAAKSNNSANDHSASLLNVDASGDVLTAGLGAVAKRMASLASPKVRPYKLKNGEKWFVMYCNSWSFRDLQGDTPIVSAQREAAVRGKNNPLFVGGDIIYRGIIYKEIEELSVLSGVGNSGIDVAPNYLCGAGALGVAYAQRPTSRTDVDDYGFDHGVAIQQMIGINKLRFGTGDDDTDTKKDHGMVTVYTAGVADS